MSLFDQFSDETLKRVFKFVLKRVIGRYLIDDIVLNQISVQSRDGIVKIFSLNVDCDVINNEFLAASTLFRVKKCSITKLEAKISYSSLLSEGFKLYIQGIDLVLEPFTISCISNITSEVSSNRYYNQHGYNNTDQLYHSMPTFPASHSKNSQISSNATSLHPNNQQNNHRQYPLSQHHLAKTTEGQEGLSFIMGWIEILIASLQVIVEDVRVIIQDSNSSGASAKSNSETANDANDSIFSKPAIVILVSKCVFSNTHPSQLPVETSANLASSFSQSKPSISSGNRNSQFNPSHSSHIQSLGTTKVRTKQINIQFM